MRYAITTLFVIFALQGCAGTKKTMTPSSTKETAVTVHQTQKEPWYKRADAWMKEHLW